MIICEYEIENDIPVIYTFSRDKNGKRSMEKDDTFRPYFYCRLNDVPKFGNDKRVSNIQDVDYTDIEGNKIAKIICKLPHHLKELRKEIGVSYEADLQFSTRYTIDKYDEIEGTPLSVVYIDIETNSDRAFPNIKAAQDDITAITCYNNFNKKCITFVWRADQQERVTQPRAKQFIQADGTTFEYEDITMYFDNERSMLSKFLKYIVDIDPDMFTGWNVHDFDMRYIINRMNNMGINFQKLSPMNMAFTNDWGDVKIKGRIIFDMLDAVRKMSYGELDSYKLDNIAFDELGEKKVKRPIRNGKEISFRDFWQSDLPLFIEYNKKDVMLTYQIQRKKKIIQSFDEVRRMSKCSFNEVFNNSYVVDSFILSFCKGMYALPTKGGHEKEDFGGGKVIKPKKGLHDWVLVKDFKALYSKIIESLNASLETIAMVKSKDTVNLRIPYIDSNKFWLEGKKKFNKRDYNKARDTFNDYFENQWNIHTQQFNTPIPLSIQKTMVFKDVSFNQEKKGFIPKILEHLFNTRIKIQEERDKYEYGSPEYTHLEFKQYALKVLMNSFYGVLGHHGFRLYKPEIAAAITFVGRNAILWTEEVAAKNGYETLYGDTDSVFILGNAKPNGTDITPIIEEGHKITKFLQDSYDAFSKLFNMKKHYLKLEFEKFYESIFFGTAKKRYAGVLAWYKGKTVEKRKVSITGFEVVRTDQSKLARATQMEVFEKLLLRKESKDDIVSYVRGIMKEIKADKYDYETIGIPTPLKKPLSEYKTNIPVVRAVQFSNRYLKLDIRPGEKFLLLYVKNIPGLTRTDVIAIRDNIDVPKDTLIDYTKHSDEATKEKMERIFDGLGWKIIELTGQKSVLDY